MYSLRINGRVKSCVKIGLGGEEREQDAGGGGSLGSRPQLRLL